MNETYSYVHVVHVGREIYNIYEDALSTFWPYTLIRYAKHEYASHLRSRLCCLLSAERRKSILSLASSSRTTTTGL